MPAIPRHPLSLRASSADYTVLVWALVVSIVIHSSGYGVYFIGDHYGIWKKMRTPDWLQKVLRSVIPPTVKHSAKQPAAEREPPLMFVEVNPANAVAEAPKNAKYYAAQSTRAANPDADKDTGIPKISGTQERITRTEDTSLQKPQPLQPAMPRPVEPAPEEVKPKPAKERGDLTLAKVDDTPRRAEGDSSKPKPRTIAEAKALQQNQRTSTTGERAKQDGGVRQRNITSSLDAVGSPFGAYDASIVAAIQERWYTLLEERSYASDRSGKVVLEFRLNYDGRVTDLRVAEHSVDELLSLLCQKAVLDPAPFARWPSDMRRMVGADYREVRFTFYYN